MKPGMDFSAQRAAELQQNFEQLLQRLRMQNNIELLDEAGFAAFVAAAGDGMVLFTQEPGLQPETWDVAVILPEILKQTGARLRAAVIPPQLARQQQSRFGITRWPCLLFVRDGAYVGVIEGMRNWDEYLREIAAMLEKPAGRAPGIGVAVMSGDASPTCH